MTLQIQIITVGASLVLLIGVLELVRRGQLREEFSLFWLLTSVGLLVLSAWRAPLFILARLMGIFYPPSALFVIGFSLSLLIMLYFSTVISVLWRQNRELAKQVAMLEWYIHRLECRLQDHCV